MVGFLREGQRDGMMGGRANWLYTFHHGVYSLFAHGIPSLFSPLATLTEAVSESSSSGVHSEESRSSSHVGRAQSRGDKTKATCDWSH